MSNNNIILLSRPVVGLLLLSTILIAVILLIDIANLAYAEHQHQPQNVTQLIQKLSTPVTSNASALGRKRIERITNVDQNRNKMTRSRKSEISCEYYLKLFSN